MRSRTGFLPPRFPSRGLGRIASTCGTSQVRRLPVRLLRALPVRLSGLFHPDGNLGVFALQRIDPFQSRTPFRLAVPFCSLAGRTVVVATPPREDPALQQKALPFRPLLRTAHRFSGRSRRDVAGPPVAVRHRFLLGGFLLRGRLSGGPLRGAVRAGQLRWAAGLHSRGPGFPWSELPRTVGTHPVRLPVIADCRRFLSDARVLRHRAHCDGSVQPCLHRPCRHGTLVGRGLFAKVRWTAAAEATRIAGGRSLGAAGACASPLPTRPRPRSEGLRHPPRACDAKRPVARALLTARPNQPGLCLSVGTVPRPCHCPRCIVRSPAQGAIADLLRASRSTRRAGIQGFEPWTGVSRSDGFHPGRFERTPLMGVHGGFVVWFVPVGPAVVPALAGRPVVPPLSGRSCADGSVPVVARRFVPRPSGIDRCDLAADFAAAPLSLLPYRAGRCWSLRVSIDRPAMVLALCSAASVSPSGFLPFCRVYPSSFCRPGLFAFRRRGVRALRVQATWPSGHR